MSLGCFVLFFWGFKISNTCQRKCFSFQFVWIQNVFEMETFILKITTESDYFSKNTRLLNQKPK